MINGIGKTALGNGGITPDDVTERITYDNVDHEVCPTVSKAGPAISRWHTH